MRQTLNGMNKKKWNYKKGPTFLFLCLYILLEEAPFRASRVLRGGRNGSFELARYCFQESLNSRARRNGNGVRVTFLLAFLNKLRS